MYGVTFDGKSITKGVRPFDLAEGQKIDYRSGGKFIENLKVDLERERVSFSIVDADHLEFARCDMGYEDIFTVVLGEKRSARVELTSKLYDADEIAQAATAYMPDNYSVRVDDEGEVLIEGFDSCGWTLEGYVIPRLASGLIFAVAA